MKPPARILFAVSAAISLVLPPAPARAQAAAEEAAAAAAYQQALTLYGSGDLEGALAQMRESHRLSHRSELLYNIARLENELGDCPASLSDYRLYVQQVPDGRYRRDAEQASTELSRRCPEAAEPTPPSAPDAAVPVAKPPPTPPPIEAPTPAVAKARPPSRSSYWTAPRLVGWSTIAAGTAASVGAVYFLTQAIDARDAFQRNVDAAASTNGPVDFKLQDRQHRGQRWAQILGVAGGALLTGGALVLIFSPTGPSGSASTTVYVQPGLLAVNVSRRF